MVPDMWLVSGILLGAVVLLVTEWVPMEVTALMVLGAVAVTGLLPPAEALAGFSNPAVVTIWAVFILSGGLTRTGVANIIGRLVSRVSGKREGLLVLVIMLTAGLLSAVMNNVAVAALMLPVVMDIARQMEIPPPRLLIPLAYGSLLGGLTTQIGTPPNILVTEALRSAGRQPYGFFDFTPIGLSVMLSGTAFMVLAGRHLLPSELPSARPSEDSDEWKQRYDIGAYLFHLRVPHGSLLNGRTLAQSRIGSALGVTVVSISRQKRHLSAPSATERLAAGDVLTVAGRPAPQEAQTVLDGLLLEPKSQDIIDLFDAHIAAAEMTVQAGSIFSGKSLNALDFHARYGVTVLTLVRQEQFFRAGFQDMNLRAGDRLLLAGPRERLTALAERKRFDPLSPVSSSKLRRKYALGAHLMILRVSPESALVEKTLGETRLGDLLGTRVLVMLGGRETRVLPGPEQRIGAGDRLLVEGTPFHLDLLSALASLEIEGAHTARVETLLSENDGVVEAVLSPHSTLAETSVRQLNFREKYGLTVLAVWRGGKMIGENLRDTVLRFGDALLLFGPVHQLDLLAGDREFVVLSQRHQQRPRLEKMGISLAIMAAVLLAVLTGWTPIYIAAVVGAAMMILTGCLSMEEAYRQIEWKAVFLIAGMLPLGAALEKTGLAVLLAEKVVAVAGPLGPEAVMLGLVVLTFLATCVVPTAALVVLMAPIVLNTAESMHLSGEALLMAVAMAASASFMTPISHPANILVMGPGGYRFMDYVKTGGALTLVVLVVLMVLMPFLWPLTP